MADDPRTKLIDTVKELAVYDPAGADPSVGKRLWINFEHYLDQFERDALAEGVRLASAGRKVPPGAETVAELRRLYSGESSTNSWSAGGSTSSRWIPACGG